MPVTRRPPLSGAVAVTIGLAVVALAALAEPSFAAGPFGVGAPEIGGGVPHGGVFGWIAARQNEFYLALKSGLRAMRADPHAGWWMVALSFAYGVFHAAGPGHGKAVITSYVLANDETLKRGIVLAFVSAMFQGLVAIVFVGTAIGLFRATSFALTDATVVLERTSAAAIFGLGLWLSWVKIVAPMIRARRAAAPRAVVASEADVVDCAIGGDPAAIAAACACGTAHIPDPSTLKGPFDWRRAVGAVVAVGLRPCTGAVIVLVFAFAQGLIPAGVASVLAMALGTGLTVAILATAAVSARGLALRFAGDDDARVLLVMRAAEIVGALIVLILGVLLVGAALQGAPAGG